ncbi:DNA/RNA non-specific endonuclease [Mobilicoccus caccae]|uniref:Endonuclease G n=1 Tax=Mobilicoccus caccae TaxID=1859295 RepID=A0ABQ6IU33_9MICO|nr:DNA/RNA non-specific endonuclease [Mobilicoccus caccae]GMA41453.1 hypothetical protein GCM10025883_34980 [Mobilicoccus caccae]
MSPKNPDGTKDSRTDALRRFVRAHADAYLADPNITSVGVGYKEVDGTRTDTVAIQFTVVEKLDEADLALVGSTPVPETIEIDQQTVPTDVVERTFRPAYVVVPEAASDTRRRRIDPGTPYALSNWHVLHGPRGRIGDAVLQPGPHDDNRVDRNRLGTLVRSHLGAAGDCAIATIEDRRFEPDILDLDVVPTEIGEPELGDKVIKSGRTTGVTHGVVTRLDVMVRLDYGEGVGEQNIGGVEIGPDPNRPAPDGQISDGGDSGSVWLFRAGNGRTSTVLAGLNFAGESPGGRDHAIANLPSSVTTKLDVTLSPTRGAQAAGHAAAARGYDPAFLRAEVPTPDLGDLAGDAVEVDGSTVIPYTHFSLTMSASRRFARWVAWNVDGDSLKKLSRSGTKFRLDPRIAKKHQVGDELYADNPIDRGHIARRADLTWGPAPEAEKANSDSFFFTNIAPQMDDFNQGARGGVWGRLEDAVYAEVEVDRHRISVMAGPILAEDDREYRGVRIPREFWKVIAFVEADELKARAFLLTQRLDRLQAFELGEFRTYQVTLELLADRSGLVFPETLTDAETSQVAQAVAQPRMLQRTTDIVW